MNSSTNSTENVAEPIEFNRSAWPFIAYVLALFLVDGLGFASMDNARSELLMVVLVSVVYGQVALAMVVGGLMGTTWLEGVFLSSFAVLCGVGICSVASGSDFQLEDTLYTATIPLLCLSGAFPLILFRWTVGWRLYPETLDASPRTRLTIENLILVPASLVAFGVMALAPTGADRNEGFWMAMSAYVLILLSLCAILVLPCTYWAFRIQDSGFRWVLCMGYPFMLSIILIVVIAASSSGLPGEAIGWIIFGALLTSGVAMVGLQLLYSGGYRLVSYKRAEVAPGTVAPAEHSEASNASSPFDLEPVASATSGNTDPQAANRKRHRIAVAALLIATAIVNTGTWTYAQMQQRRSLVKIISNGGSVEMVNGKPIKISFGPSTTEEEINELPPMHSVKSISVSGTKVTSFHLRNNFNSLVTLDIRKTSLVPDELRLRTSIEIIVSEGQFTGSDLQDFKLQGLSVKEVAD